MKFLPLIHVPREQLTDVGLKHEIIVVLTPYRLIIYQILNRYSLQASSDEGLKVKGFISSQTRW